MGSHQHNQGSSSNQASTPQSAFNNIFNSNANPAPTQDKHHPANTDPFEGTQHYIIGNTSQPSGELGSIESNRIKGSAPNPNTYTQKNQLFYHVHDKTNHYYNNGLSGSVVDGVQHLHSVEDQLRMVQNNQTQYLFLRNHTQHMHDYIHAHNNNNFFNGTQYWMDQHIGYDVNTSVTNLKNVFSNLNLSEQDALARITTLKEISINNDNTLNDANFTKLNDIINTIPSNESIDKVQKQYSTIMESLFTDTNKEIKYTDEQVKNDENIQRIFDNLNLDFDIKDTGLKMLGKTNSVDNINDQNISFKRMMPEINFNNVDNTDKTCSELLAEQEGVMGFLEKDKYFPLEIEGVKLGIKIGKDDKKLTIEVKDGNSITIKSIKDDDSNVLAKDIMLEAQSPNFTTSSALDDSKTYICKILAADKLKEYAITTSTIIEKKDVISLVRDKYLKEAGLNQNIGTVLSALEDLDTTSINNGVLPVNLDALKTNATIDLTTANDDKKLEAENARMLIVKELKNKLNSTTEDVEINIGELYNNSSLQTALGKNVTKLKIIKKDKMESFSELEKKFSNTGTTNTPVYVSMEINETLKLFDGGLHIKKLKNDKKIEYKITDNEDKEASDKYKFEYTNANNETKDILQGANYNSNQLKPKIITKDNLTGTNNGAFKIIEKASKKEIDFIFGSNTVTGTNDPMALIIAAYNKFILLVKNYTVKNPQYKMNFTKRAMNTAILEAKILTDPVKRVQRKSKGNRNGTGLLDRLRRLKAISETRNRR